MILRTLPLLCLAAPAAAQGLSIPGNCSLELTLQLPTCEAVAVMVCDGGQHDVWFGPDGLTSSHSSFADGTWDTSVYMEPYAVEVTIETSDRFSWDVLLSDGSDSMSVVTDSAYYGVTVYEVEDRLTGTTVTIDGVDLLEATFDQRGMTPDGESLFFVTGQSFVYEPKRLWLPGLVDYPEDPEQGPIDYTPVHVFLPGEEGFGEIVPTEGCS